MFGPGTLGEAGFRGWWRLPDLFRASLSGEAWGPRGNRLQSLALNLGGQQNPSSPYALDPQVVTVEDRRRKLDPGSRQQGEWLPTVLWCALGSQPCAQCMLGGAQEAEVTVLSARSGLDFMRPKASLSSFQKLREAQGWEWETRVTGTFQETLAKHGWESALCGESSLNFAWSPLVPYLGADTMCTFLNRQFPRVM